MSDRIAVMNAGKVEQVGRPRDMYEEPGTAFVADFLGISNLLRGRISRSSANSAAVTLEGDVEIEASSGDMGLRGDVMVTIRPERIVIEPAHAAGPNRLPAMISRTVYQGASQQVYLQLAAGPVLTVLSSHQGDEPPPELAAGSAVMCYLPAASVRVLRPSAT